MKRLTWMAVVLGVVALAVLLTQGAAPALAQGREAPPDRCEVKCEQVGQRVYRQCIADGGAEERCKNRAAKEVEACLLECRKAVDPAPKPVDPQPRACKARCEAYAQKVFRLCMALPIGPTRQQCERRRLQALELCMQKTCPPKEVAPPTDPDPQVCREKCEERARDYYERCLRGGTGATPPTDCGAKARQMLSECVAKHCTPASVDPNPAPRGCLAQCRQAASAFYERCMAQPEAVPERCKNQMQIRYEECAKTCNP